MASGQDLLMFFAGEDDPPAANAAELKSIAGASTPAESIKVLAYDDTTAEYTDFRLTMPLHYAGGGITLSLKTSASATSNTYSMRAAIRRIQDDAEDLDTTAQTYDFNNFSSPVSPPSAVGEITYDDITFTNGVDMDNLAAGEDFILRVGRFIHGGTETAGDVFLHSGKIKET